MKLSTKLKLSFLLMWTAPFFLCFFAVGILVKIQNDNFKAAYGNESPELLHLSTPVVLMSRITDSVYEDMRIEANRVPEQFNNVEYLDGWAEKLKKSYSSLVVSKDKQLIYSNYNYDPDIIQEMLPEYAGDENLYQFGIYYGDQFQCLVKQIDFTDSTGGFYSAYIITESARMIPHMKFLIMEFIVVIVLIFILTSFLLTAWIYHSVVRPINKLKMATQKIKEGNLDFELEQENFSNEISNLMQDFEEMRCILKENAEEKLQTETEEKELIRNISHDLKTPITTIKGYVEGLLDGVADTPEKQEKYLRTISNKANDMDKLIDELTMYSQLDMNRIPYNFTRINIDQYLMDCCEELSIELETRGIALEYNNYANEEQFVMLDAEQMKRVITNIIGNSVKYIPASRKKGLIRMEVFSDSGYLLIRIEDNGCGIAPEDLKHIFDRFYRTDASRNSQKGGSGIGLAIVKKVVEEHGGQIWAESKEGVGTTINLRLKKIVDKGEQFNE